VSARAIRAAAALALAAACGDPGARVEPVIDTPVDGSDGYPWTGLTDLELSIAAAGADADLETTLAAAGEELALDDLPFGADLVLHLSGRENAFEVAYGRTCPFAVSDAQTPTPHLYFARVLRWAAAPTPATAADSRGDAYATPDGALVFVAAGRRAGVERFDPTLGGFATVELDPALEPRSQAALVALADGRGLRIGGVDAAGDAVAALEVIDPRLDAAVPLAAQSGPRVVEHAAVALVDGDVLVVGGRTQPEAGAPFAVTGATYLLHLGDDGALEPPQLLEAEPATPRAGLTATRLGDEVGADLLLIGGRADDGAPVGQAELYRPLRGSFELVDGAVLAIPRWGHRAIRLPGGFVLVVGGLTDDGLGGTRPVDEVELYDPVQGRFSLAGTLPARAGILDLSATPLPDGRVLLAGGVGADGLAVDTVLIAAFDPLSGEVTLSPTDRMDAPRSGHAAARLCDGTILVVGGADEASAPAAERYDPPSAGRR
jgi:hypothetical protein